jgi:hypothetical protein
LIEANLMFQKNHEFVVWIEATSSSFALQAAHHYSIEVFLCELPPRDTEYSYLVVVEAFTVTWIAAVVSLSLGRGERRWGRSAPGSVLSVVELVAGEADRPQDHQF